MSEKGEVIKLDESRRIISHLVVVAGNVVFKSYVAVKALV